MMMMFERLQITPTLFIDACDEDIGTIVQDVHGVDYEVMEQHGVKVWKELHDPRKPRLELICALHQRLVVATSLRKKHTTHDGMNGRMTFARFAKMMLDELKTTHPHLNLSSQRMAIVKMLWSNEIAHNV